MFNKGLMFTDTHFGRKNNSIVHNTDCSNFIDWVIEKFYETKSDHIAFLGDWFENRNAINTQTLQLSHDALERLSKLDVPIFIMVGNHDMYNRHSREVYATSYFRSVKNLIVIDKPTICNDIGNGVLMCPFLFKDEYKQLNDYKHVPIWMGHFEFNDFILTGDFVKMSNANSIEIAKNAKRVFSGHFHKRQKKDNIIYIGNAFPMDFSDANDHERGCCVYDHVNDKVEFFNWKEQPTYNKVKLSDLIRNEKFDIRGTIQCIVDIDLSFEETIELKKSVLANSNVRDFNFVDERVNEVFDNLQNVEVDKLLDIDNQIISMLQQISAENIAAYKLVDVYKNL